MPSSVYLGFDFGYKRIGVAVGQQLTCSASPLATLNARAGVPDWNAVAKVIAQWSPQALVVGIPTCIDGSELYTTVPARRFAQELHKRFALLSIWLMNDFQQLLLESNCLHRAGIVKSSNLRWIV